MIDSTCCVRCGGKREVCVLFIGKYTWYCVRHFDQSKREFYDRTEMPWCTVDFEGEEGCSRYINHMEFLVISGAPKNEETNNLLNSPTALDISSIYPDLAMGNGNASRNGGKSVKVTTDDSDVRVSNSTASDLWNRSISPEEARKIAGTEKKKRK